jgi:hypothetical protein
MRRPSSAHVRAAFALAALAAAVSATPITTPLAAQRTRDQSTLVITLMPGFVWGSDLWSVDRQPIFASPGSPDPLTDPPVFDTLALKREIRSSIAMSFAATYFPGANIGFTGEAVLLGVGYRDTCRLVASTQPRPREICTDPPGGINNFEKAATAVVVSAGAIGRINSRKRLSPYARLGGGVLVSNQSSLRTIGTDFPDGSDPDGAPVDVIVYDDDRSTRFTPALLLGLGFTAQLSPGFQLRWEARDNVVGVRAVTAATTTDGTIPPSELRFKHLPSVFIGIDVVLERRRGRRY